MLEINKILDNIISFLITKYTTNELNIILPEFSEITTYKYTNIQPCKNTHIQSHTTICENLANFNETTSNRKSRGAYYTSQNIANFIIINALNQFYSQNKKNEKLDNELKLNIDEISDYINNRTTYDPASGNGEFILSVLKTKIDLMNISKNNYTPSDILSTIYGNDIDETAVLITKLRLFILLIQNFKINELKGLGKILNKNITNSDFLTITNEKKFDFIVGNPPYIEFNKAISKPNENYGNIYANFMIYSSKLLKTNGILAFIVPISYISTPRMSKVRYIMSQNLPKQHILNFSDRPACLFKKVHQKLSIFIGQNNKEKEIYTSKYIMWYSKDYDLLLNNIEIYKSQANTNFIPKIGNKVESNIYKITKSK